MGSGTTAKASIQLDRNWIGSELDNDYCTICKKRLASVTTQTQLFDDIITRESLKK